MKTVRLIEAKSNQNKTYWPNIATLINHVKCNLKKHGSHSRKKNKKGHCKANSHLNLSRSVGAFIIMVGSLLHKTKSLTEKAAFFLKNGKQG